MTARERLLGRVRTAQRLLLWRAFEREGLGATIALLTLALVMLVLLLVAPLYRAELSLLRAGLAAAIVVLLLLAAVRVARARSSLDRAALEAGRIGPGREDEILTGLLLARAGRTPEGADSIALREHALRAAADRADAVPLKKLRLWSARRTFAAAAGIALGGLIGVAVAGGSRTPRVLRHLADPSSAPLAPIHVRVEPGSQEVDGGASVVIRAYVEGTRERPRLVTLAAGDRKGEPMKDALDEDESARGSERAYTVTLRNLKEDVFYRVRVGGRETEEYTIAIRDLPRATGYRVRYDYPAYTGLPAEEGQAVTGDLVAPRGTRARLDVSLNRSLGRASLVLDRAGGALDGELGERTARFTIPVRSDEQYTLRLEDPRGRRADLGPFEIRAIPDRPPTILVLEPGPVEDVTRSMTTTLVAGATDDYGVRKILIRYRVRQDAERTETLHEEPAGARELAVRYTWGLQPFGLLPGDEIEYQLGATDGNAIDGPKTSWSEPRRLRFPSATEILAGMQQQRDAAIETLEDALRETRELQKKAEDLARATGGMRELTWEKQQEIQRTLESQEQIRDRIDKVAEELARDAEKLAQSRALNAELAKKVEELHQLLSQLRDQSLRRSIQQLEEALKKLSPEEMARALENVKLTQEDALRSLEHTIEMLKQIRLEEMLEEASERAAEMERRQLAVNDSLGHARESEALKQLEGSEAAIEAMSREERAALDSLAAELASRDPQSASEAEELNRELGPQGAQPEFQKARESMQKGDRSEARKTGAKLAERLKRVREQMDQMREGYTARRKNELAKAMEGAAMDLLEIAAMQEGMLGDERSSMSGRAETQKGIEETTRSAANRIGEIAKKTLFIGPQVGQAIGRALIYQENSIGRYSEQDLVGGLQGSKEAAISLNQGAAALLRARESMQGSSSSTGFQEAMQQLQGLGGEQQALNEQTLGMMDGAGEGGEGGSHPRPGDGGLDRLAAQQEAIRRGLEDAMQKVGEGGGTLGRLGDVADEMKEVEQELRAGRLGEPTVEKQRRILSRLLDAPRSVEKRDYSRKRTSRPGVDVVRTSPGALSGDLIRARSSLAALLARGGRDPVAPRYRALVEEYIQSILEGKAR